MKYDKEAYQPYLECGIAIAEYLDAAYTRHADRPGLIIDMRGEIMPMVLEHWNFEHRECIPQFIEHIGECFGIAMSLVATDDAAAPLFIAAKIAYYLPDCAVLRNLEEEAARRV